MIGNSIHSNALLFLHGVIGWALCGAVMGLGMKVASLRSALIAHALAAPVIFALLAWSYTRWFPSTPPLLTAAAFLGTVMVLDALIVAGLIQRSLKMFASIPGTWLPFALIFLASWITTSLAAEP